MALPPAIAAELLVINMLFMGLLNPEDVVVVSGRLLEMDITVALERSVRLATMLVTEGLVTTTAGADSLCAFIMRGFGGGTIVVVAVVVGRVELDVMIPLEEGRRESVVIELYGRLAALSRLDTR